MLDAFGQDRIWHGFNEACPYLGRTLEIVVMVIEYFRHRTDIADKVLTIFCQPVSFNHMTFIVHILGQPFHGSNAGILYMHGLSAFLASLHKFHGDLLVLISSYPGAFVQVYTEDCISLTPGQVWVHFRMKRSLFLHIPG